MSSSADRYAVCERVVRQGSFGADVVLTREAGVAAIGVDADAVDTIGVGEAKRILDGEGIRASSYMGLGEILLNDGTSTALDETRRRLEVAAALGAPSALVMSGPLGSLAIGDADARCREWLERAAPIGAELGVRIALEPMHPMMRRWSFVHSLDHALALVDGVAGAGLVFDLGHVWWERDLELFVRDHVDAIVAVQVTNVDTAALAEFRYERSELDAGDVPVASLVSLLESAGYRGWYENEILTRVPRDQRLERLRASRRWFDAL